MEFSRVSTSHAPRREPRPAADRQAEGEGDRLLALERELARVEKKVRKVEARRGPSG